MTQKNILISVYKRRLMDEISQSEKKRFTEAIIKLKSGQDPINVENWVVELELQ